MAKSLMTKIMVLLVFVCTIHFLSACTHAVKPAEAPKVKSFFRAKTFLYFDKNDSIQDITESLEMPFYIGAFYGWSIPLKDGHGQWKIKEVLTITCDIGTVSEHNEEWTIEAIDKQIKSFYELEATDCRGIYDYKIFINNELSENFKLKIT